MPVIANMCSSSLSLAFLFYKNVTFIEPGVISMKNKKKSVLKNLSFIKTRIGFLFVVSGLACTQSLAETIPDEGFVEGRPSLLGTTMLNLDTFDYQQSEYFIKGTATSYTNTTGYTSDGKWQIEPNGQADFKTRIVVYQPKDPAKFNGTVIFEWFNVSGGTEASSSWIMGHTELVRSGYAWVGISAQQPGIEKVDGVKILNVSMPLKAVKPKRYESLSHPGDAFAYDIFRQAAEAVIKPGNFKPLGELNIKQTIAMGESQSADHLLTYINTLAPQEKLFDGFIVHSRVHGAKTLEPDPGAERIDFKQRDTVKVREDLDVPVMIVQTESDLTVLGSYPDRQPDTDLIRTWEIAGTAHADRYVGGAGLTDKGTNYRVADVVETHYAVPLLVECDKPVNSGPQHFVVKAAIAAMNNWLSKGQAPTQADPLTIDDATGQFVRDEHGNALGGVRTPYVDVPIATLSGEGQAGFLSEDAGDNEFCSIYGTTKLFDDAKLASLYPTQRSYVSAVRQSLNKAVKKGFLLQADADLIEKSARKKKFGINKQNEQ